MSHGPGARPVRVFGIPIGYIDEIPELRLAVQMYDAGILTSEELRATLSRELWSLRPREAMPAITGLRPLTECSCGRSLMPGMRFCDACGRPLSYTGKTERLDQGPPLNYPTEAAVVLFK